MKISIALEDMKKEICDAGLQAQMQETSQKPAEEQLVVPLTPDSHGHERVLLIKTHTPPSSIKEKDKKTNRDYNIQFIQFFVPMPIRIKKEQLEDVRRLLNMLNTVSELPGFFIAEKDSIPFFRYNMTCTQQQVDGELLVMTIGLILYVLENYTDVIDKLASGEKKLEDLEDHDFKK